MWPSEFSQINTGGCAFPSLIEYLDISHTFTLINEFSGNIFSIFPKFKQISYLFHDGAHFHIETSPVIFGANQWTGFCMITASVMKELILFVEINFIED